MRHGFAGQFSLDPKTERERPLLPEGKATVLAMCKAIDKAGEYPKSIFCSPFARTTMTADIVGKYFGVSVNVVGGFAPVRPLETEIYNLVSADRLKRVFICCHVDNSSPAMKNFDSPDKWKDLVMAEVRRVEMSRKDCSWTMQFVLKPSDIGLRDR